MSAQQSNDLLPMPKANGGVTRQHLAQNLNLALIIQENVPEYPVEQEQPPQLLHNQLQ